MEISTKAFAEKHGVEPETVVHLINLKEGHPRKIKARRLGREWLIDESHPWPEQGKRGRRSGSVNAKRANPVN